MSDGCDRCAELEERISEFEQLLLLARSDVTDLEARVVARLNNPSKLNNDIMSQRRALFGKFVSSLEALDCRLSAIPDTGSLHHGSAGRLYMQSRFLFTIP